MCTSPSSKLLTSKTFLCVLSASAAEEEEDNDDEEDDGDDACEVVADDEDDVEGVVGVFEFDVTFLSLSSSSSSFFGQQIELSKTKNEHTQRENKYFDFLHCYFFSLPI